MLRNIVLSMAGLIMDAFDQRKFHIVKDLLLWKSSLDSLSVFASFNFFFLLLLVYQFPLATLVAYILLGYLGCLYLLQLVGYSISTEDDYEFISRDLIASTLSLVHEKSNAVLRGISEMSMDETFVQVLLALFLGVYVAQMVSFAGFVWLSTFLAFTVPALYKTYEDFVDGQLSTASKAYSQYKELALRSIPRAKSVRS
jgi:hypothetical protein